MARTIGLSLDAEAIRGAAETAWLGRQIVVQDATGSTNDDALTRAEAGARPGLVVVADQQSAGRGSHGRLWQSPAGTDLYFSVVLDPELPDATVEWLTLGSGLAVAEAIEPFLSRSAEIKWPNDIWVADRKVAGILAESRRVGSQCTGLVVGIGLNVNRERFENLDRPATSLRIESGTAHDRNKVLGAVLAALERRLTELGPRLLEEISSRLALIGKPVQVESPTESFDGVFEGLDERGSALVRGTDAVHRLRSGRIHPR